MHRDVPCADLRTGVIGPGLKLLADEARELRQGSSSELVRPLLTTTKKNVRPSDASPAPPFPPHLRLPRRCALGPQSRRVRCRRRRDRVLPGMAVACRQDSTG